MSFNAKRVNLVVFLMYVLVLDRSHVLGFPRYTRILICAYQMYFF